MMLVLSWTLGTGVLAFASSAWFLGLIAALCGVFAVMRWPAPSAPGAEVVVRTSWLIPAVFGLLGPALVGMIITARSVIDRLSRYNSEQSWVLAGGVILTLAIGLWLAVNWPAEWPAWTFPLVAGTAGLVIRIAFLSFVVVEPVSDFKGMWEIAGRVSDGGVGTTLDQEDPIDYIHFHRTLPYLLPLRITFGPSRWVYGLANSFLTVGSSLLTFCLARRFFGARAGRASLVLSLLAPETVLATGIPSHDVPGAFLTLLALVSFLVVHRLAVSLSWQWAAMVSFALALLLVLVELQRSNRSFLFAGYVLFLLGAAWIGTPGRERRPRRTQVLLRRILLCLVVPYLLGVVTSRAVVASGLALPEATSQFLKSRALAAHTDSWASGEYAYAVGEYNQRFDLDADSWADLAWRKLLSDTVYSPGARLSSTLRRAVDMFDLGSQFNFYFGELPKPGGSRTLGSPARNDLALANRTFVSLFLALLIAGTITVWWNPRTPLAAFFPALYLAVLLGTLLLIFQPQPRYAFQIWYVGALYAGALFRRRTALAGRKDDRREGHVA